jgi:hypothetical protein
VEEIFFIAAQFLVQLLDVGVFRQDGFRPGGTVRHLINGVEEEFDTFGGEGAVEGIGGAGFYRDFPFAGRQEFIDGNQFVAGSGHFGGVFIEMAQVMMG